MLLCNQQYYQSDENTFKLEYTNSLHGLYGKK